MLIEGGSGKREREDETEAWRAGVATSMALIADEHDVVMYAVDEMLVAKGKLRAFLSLPSERWPFFTVYEFFWKYVAQRYFLTAINRSEYDSSMGALESEQSSPLTAMYYQGKREDESDKEYVMRNLHVLSE